MTNIESRLARLEERATDMEDWKEACAKVPETVATLVEWKRQQNGLLKELRDDVRFLREQYSERLGVERFAKYILGLVGISGISWIVVNIVQAVSH